VIKAFFYIIAVLLIAGSAFGADYYIDPSLGGGTEDGLTPANAFHSWADVTWDSGDDYRQKCGTTSTTTFLDVTESGISENPIIISAYNADGSHEDGGNETFGNLCSGGLAKPIISQTDDTNTLFRTPIGGSTYIYLNSMRLDTAQYGARIRSSYNKVQYCYFYFISESISVGLAAGAEDADYNTFEYNYIDSNDSADETLPASDGIELNYRAQNNLVRYNHITGADHGAVNIYGGDSNTVEYNYFFESNGHEDFGVGFNANAESNIIRFNYILNHGQAIEIYGGDYNEFYGNVTRCDSATNPTPYNYQGCWGIIASAGSSATNIDNLIYNNVIYGNDATNGHGIQITTNATSTGETSGNKIYNNVIQDVGYWGIIVQDGNDNVGTNYFYNNDVYEFGQGQGTPTNYFASIEGTTYTAAQISTFNARADASGNIVTEPGFNNIGANEFWPASASSNIVGSGCDMNDSEAPCYVPGYTASETVLDDGGTDFTATPPEITTLTQEEDWIIGAYGLGLYISSALPLNNATDVSTTVTLTWSNPTAATSIDLLLDKKSEHDPPTTVKLNDQADESWDASTLDTDTEYAWRVDVNHAGGTETGTVYYFTTAGGPPVQVSIQGSLNYASGGAEIKYSADGMEIK